MIVVILLPLVSILNRSSRFAWALGQDMPSIGLPISRAIIQVDERAALPIPARAVEGMTSRCASRRVILIVLT